MLAYAQNVDSGIRCQNMFLSQCYRRTVNNSTHAQIGVRGLGYKVLLLTILL